MGSRLTLHLASTYFNDVESNDLSGSLAGYQYRSEKCVPCTMSLTLAAQQAPSADADMAMDYEGGCNSDAANSRGAPVEQGTSVDSGSGSEQPNGRKRTPENTIRKQH